MLYPYLGIIVKRSIYNLLIKRWYNKETVRITDLSMTQPLFQDIPIWFEFDSGQRINLNSSVIFEDTTGLYQFLRCRGQRLIAKQIRVNSKFVAVPRFYAPIIFYEKNYRNWQL